jgi:hypothetical protein
VSADLVGPLSRVWFADSWQRPHRYYDLPKSTLDLRYKACADHHPACDCREADIAESFAEHKAEFDELYNAVLAAIKGHQTYAFTPGGSRDEFTECKCGACGIARAARVGWFECRRQREEADARHQREVWKRRNRGATLAPVYPYADIEVPF